MFLLLVFAIILLRETERQSLYIGNIIRRKESLSLQAKFPM
jgi:hypothetical protein